MGDNTIRNLIKLISIGFMLTLAAQPAIGLQSTCFGETKNGRLENGVKLPMSGENFVSYSTLLHSFGRTYVHSTVSDIVVDAYAALNSSHPKTKFKYAETGLVNGGAFRPHKTHQNGLSVDFMVPVLNDGGTSVHLPTNPTNRWGYDIEFDNRSRFKGMQIDYEAMAAHLVTLHKAALEHEVDIWRVIFDPKLQKHLHSTKNGAYIRKNLKLSTKRSWVRHDEHYHVDFKVPCKPL